MLVLPFLLALQATVVHPVDSRGAGGRHFAVAGEITSTQTLPVGGTGIPQ